MSQSKSSLETLQDQFIDTLTTTQEVVVGGVSSVSSNLSGLSTGDLPKPAEVWNSSFDFLGRVIESQRQFGVSLIEAVTPQKAESSAS